MDKQVVWWTVKSQADTEQTWEKRSDVVYWGVLADKLLQLRQTMAWMEEWHFSEDGCSNICILPTSPPRALEATSSTIKNAILKCKTQNKQCWNKLQQMPWIESETQRSLWRERYWLSSERGQGSGSEIPPQARSFTREGFVAEKALCLVASKQWVQLEAELIGGIPTSEYPFLKQKLEPA